MGKEEKAYRKGCEDGWKGRGNPTNLVTAVLTGTRYEPTGSRGEREAYKAGFERGYKGD